jgi:hypothetical protein
LHQILIAWLGVLLDEKAEPNILALSYAAKIEAVIGQPSFIQPQLFHWWNETENKAR